MQYKISIPIFNAEAKLSSSKSRKNFGFSSVKEKKMPLNFVDTYKKVTFAGRNG
jgi:hypothetical protein